MHAIKLTDRQSSAKVYIILRVFNLDTDRIDVRLYVDPANMQGKGLEFTPESYSVVLSSTIQTVD
jgi:predicted Zn-ribbon and HTH transcriptional regulator